MRLSAVNATVPPAAALEPVPTSAPRPPTPVPAMLNASVPMSTLLISSVVPLLTTVPAADVPSAPALAAVNVPALTVVRPV